MPIPSADKRHYRVSENQAFHLYGGNALYSLDDLSEAINLIDQDSFRHHVDEGKNDFANWVEHVFGEADLAQQLREHPTPLRMMVSIERFLRQHELTQAPATPSSETPASNPPAMNESPALPNSTTHTSEPPTTPANPMNSYSSSPSYTAPSTQEDSHANPAAS